MRRWSDYLSTQAATPDTRKELRHNDAFVGECKERAECATQREEARSLWMRLSYPTPDDPFGPSEGFSEDAIRLATLGCTYLELAEVVGELGCSSTSSSRNGPSKWDTEQSAVYASMARIPRRLCVLPADIARLLPDRRTEWG